MREIGTIIGGIGLLIFLGLCLSNPSAVTSIANGVSSSSVGLIAQLQKG